MLNTKSTSVPTLSRPQLAPLNFAEPYSLSSTNNNQVQTNTNLNATANPSQTLYQPHTSPNIGPSAILPSSPSTVNPMNPSSVNTLNYAIPFAAKNKCVKRVMYLNITILLKSIYIKMRHT